METVLEGKIVLTGNHIDTDQIFPGRYLTLTDPAEIAKHTMEGADPNFLKSFNPGDILVAGVNFGCGSSREHAAIALQAAGVSLVIADSFARIFFRNCINLGLPLLICPGIQEQLLPNDRIRADLKTGLVQNLSQKTTIYGEPLSEYVLQIIKAGGIKPLLRDQHSNGK